MLIVAPSATKNKGVASVIFISADKEAARVTIIVKNRSLGWQHASSS